MAESKKPEPNVRVVLIPVDGSANADRAFLWYARNMKRDNDRLVLVLVKELPNMSTAHGSNEQLDLSQLENLIAGGDKRAKEIEAKYHKMCEDESVKDYHFFVVTARKNPGEGIIFAAEENWASVIVMGNRGHGTLRRTIFGSNSDYVLHHAHIPVIVVPPESHHKHK